MAAQSPDLQGIKARRKWSTLRLFGCLLGVGLAVEVIYVFWVEPGLTKTKYPPRPAHVGVLTPSGGMGSTPFIHGGLETPTTVPASEANLPDDAEVIGIQVGNRFRAYHLAAMEVPIRHVINDVVNHLPVSVTYCNLTECVRAFVGKSGCRPLALGLGGLQGGEMVLRWNGVSYYQRTGRAVAEGLGELPLQEYPHTRTTWKAWREAHPDTDLFTIQPASNSPLGDTELRGMK